MLIEVQDITFYEAYKCHTHYTILPKDEIIDRQKCDLRETEKYLDLRDWLIMSGINISHNRNHLNLVRRKMMALLVNANIFLI